MKRYNRLSLKRHDAGIKREDRWFYKGKSPGKRRKVAFSESQAVRCQQLAAVEAVDSKFDSGNATPRGYGGGPWETAPRRTRG